jgi:hypothetical protein
MKTAEERFWLKVTKTEQCWLWTASTQRGYGAFAVRAGKLIRAHRFSYELLVGPIPEGLVIDHLCRVRACVNPAHMEVVTMGENTARSNRAKTQTHCKRGHAFSPENTYNRPDGARVCRVCLNAKCRAYYARKVGKA